MSTIILWIAGALAQDTPGADAPTPEEPSTQEPSAEEPSTEEPSTGEEAPDPKGEQEDADLNRAMELFENGRTLFEEGNYEAAIMAWQESYDLSKRPTLLFNIASAAERLSDYDRAVQALSTYRAFATEDEKEALNRRLRNLEKQRDEKEADEAAQAAASPPATPEPTPSKKRGTGQRIAGGALIGLGVVGIGTGVTLGVLSNGKQNQAKESCLDSGLCLVDAKAGLDQSSSLALGGDVALIAGIVSAGVGAALVITAPSGTVSVGVNSIRFQRRF